MMKTAAMLLGTMIAARILLQHPWLVLLVLLLVWLLIGALER